MRIRTLALALVLGCGLSMFAQAQMPDQSAARKAAQKRAKRQAKHNKAPKYKKAKVKHTKVKRARHA
jgi:hypothetical protein